MSFIKGIPLSYKQAKAELLQEGIFFSSIYLLVMKKLEIEKTKPLLSYQF